MAAIPPLFDRLIVQVNVRLGQERYKTRLNTKFCRDFASVLSTTRAPQVQNATLSMELFDSSQDRWNWDTFSDYGTNQCVVDIDEDYSRAHDA